MSDPFIRSQSSRQNLGSTRFPNSAKTAKAGTPSDAQVAEAHLKSAGPGGSKEKLNNFLTKLETTWKLFNKSSEASGKGELPEGKLALLEEGESPTPETLKMLRQRFKQSAKKPQKGAQYLFKSGPEQQKSSQKKAPSSQANGPKQSDLGNRNTPKAPSQGPKPPAPQAKQAQPQTAKPKAPASQPQQPPTSQKPPAAKPQAQKPPPAPKPPPQQQSTPAPREQSKPPAHMQRRPSPPSPSGQKKGAVLGRKPGTSGAAAKKSATPQSKQSAKPSQSGGSQPSPQGQQATPKQRMLGQRRPQLLRRPGGGGLSRGPAGSPTSKSFLGSSSHANAQLRSSDASGQPGKASASAPSRQAVFSQSVAQVNPRLKKRQVSSQMPVHNSVLDECHEDGSSDSGPIKLSWNSGKKAGRSPAQRLFAHRRRLQLSRQGGGGRSMGSPISMKGGQAAMSSARTDVSTRIAGAAIGSLLEDLYDEEDVENLDEETAVTSLGLILRLGGEFTYEHSTRVLDLALELADEVGVRDKTTRKKIKYGTVLRDVGEFDLLLQGDPDSDKRMKEFSGFLAGQDMLRAGLLHDIGKVKIPPEILYKPGKLTDEEYELMKMHPIYGEEIVKPIASLRYLCPTIRGHHERWDGKGYPDGLSGEDIPLAARIISVADVFDALAAERPYKRGMEVRKVRGILLEGRGSHFDPFLVDSFLEVILRRYPEASA